MHVVTLFDRFADGGRVRRYHALGAGYPFSAFVETELPLLGIPPAAMLLPLIGIAAMLFLDNSKISKVAIGRSH